jgi:hypothetical protein
MRCLGWTFGLLSGFHLAQRHGYWASGLKVPNVSASQKSVKSGQSVAYLFSEFAGTGH